MEEWNVKKLMILGGGVNQLGLIRAARAHGCRVILCDNDTRCAAYAQADVFCHINITDADRLTEQGRIIGIDGIISNSEIAMKTVAVVAQRLGLPGNPPESIAIMQSKHDFRIFQEKIQSFAPKNRILRSADHITQTIQDLSYPIIVKPEQCSGTRGTRKFANADLPEIRAAVEECISYSRNKVCTVEEYVQMPKLAVLEGDVFVNEGRFFWGGLYFTYRSKDLPMVPMTYVSPYVDSAAHMERIQYELSRIFNRLGIRTGEYNVEAYFDSDDHFFVIEINARQGGHGLPAYVKLATGVDMDKLLVTTAVGDNTYFEEVLNSPLKQRYATRHTVFGHKSGHFSGIYIHEEIRKYVVQVEQEIPVGALVKESVNGSGAIGFVNLLFESFEQQHYYSENIEQYIYPEMVY